MRKFIDFVIMPAFLLALAVVAAVLIGFVLFLRQLPMPNTVPQSFNEAEAAVVFTGGGQRVDTGTLLVRKGFTGPVLITGVGEGVTLQDIFKHQKVTPQHRIQVTLDYRAGTTRQNVEETIKWARANEVKEIFLITAFYHMPRSVELFAQDAPDIKVVPWAVFPAGVSTQLLAYEYVKYVAVLIGLQR